MFVYGRPASEVGILAFNASTNSISAGESVTLSWQVEEVLDVAIYPQSGSVMSQTDTSGLGSLILAPAESTTYLMIATNATTVYTNYIAITVDDVPNLPRINEFVAANRLSLLDGKQNASDWIELYNPGEQPFDLTGYGLSDNPAAPLKWIFPEVSITPHGYLIIFASGDNDPFDDQGNLHASWKLSADGESVVLTAPDGVTTIDSVIAFPSQGEDLAYGRDLNDTLTFLEPTPRAPNRAPSYTGWLAPIAFSNPRGFYTNSFTLSIPLHTRGAQILYSLDGSEPATPFSGALAITETTTVRARITKAGFKSPRTQTASYIFIDDVITSSVMNQAIAQDPLYAARLKSGLMDLPTLSIAVPQLPDDYIQREASVEILWPNGIKPIQANCGMIRFGGAYQTFAKKNYRLKFNAKFGTPKLEAPLFPGMDHGFPVSSVFDELELGAGSQDMVDRGFYMSARFVEDCMLDMGSLNPHGQFTHLYINGVYWGQFNLRERVVEHFLADYLGGKPEEYFNVKGNDNVGGTDFVLGTPDPLYRDSWNRIRNLKSSYQSVKPHLDVASLIDFMLLWDYGNCENEFRSAGPAEAGSGFKFWIADSDGFLRTTTSDKTANTGPGGLFGALVAEGDPDFKILLADRIYKHFFNGGALTPQANSTRLTTRMNEIQDSLIAECARWGYRTPANWIAAEQNIQINMFPVRTAQLFTYLKNRGLYPSFNPPEFDPPGGSVPAGHQPQLSAPEGTIYYTLDGTDPRLPGGGISSSALLYSTGETSTRTLIPAGAAWRYLDNGSDQGTTWSQSAFNDSAWASGAAELGYGDGQATLVSYGPDASQKYITTYFRHTFQATDIAAISSLQLSLLRDDGAIVYLNGTEVVRDNIQAGNITFTTLAATAVGGADESTFFQYTIPVNLLQEGDNVVAVEIHQINLTTSDLSFNLKLTATLSEAPVGNSEITLTDDTLISTRVLTGGEWSALSTAQFSMMARVPADEKNITITEIHYNPDGSDDFEFIEIYNSGTNLVDLSGVTLAGAVDFTFPDGLGFQPGEFLIVVEEIEKFEERYQESSSPWYYPEITVAGEWSGALSNDGEIIALIASNHLTIASFGYQSEGDWPERANGEGSSLELRDLHSLPTTHPERNTALSMGENWRSSSLYHGSPGRFDDYIPSLVINEVLSHTDMETDWIELYNSSTDVINIAGLFLSDHRDNPLRFEIPDPTEIQPGGYVSFSSTQLGFGFSELGSDALLTAGSGSELVRFIDTVDFPAAEREEPFGRYRKSDGNTDFTELVYTSKNAANALPRVGPIIFSEIMYHPADGMSEYVELINITAVPVPLFDTENPANTWELSGAVTYSFPEGIELAPGIPLIICATNPAAFRIQYGVAPSVVVLGPWNGALNNGGESIKLRCPGDPEPDDFVPYYRADRVAFTPDAPWPVAAGTGNISLIRKSFESYGNDPDSWKASIPSGTPGVADVNRPPLWQPIPALYYPAALELLFDSSAFASDPDLPIQSLVFAESSLPDGLTINSLNGHITGAGVTSGAYEVNLIVSDNQAPPLSATNQFMLTLTDPFVMQVGALTADGFQFIFPTIPGESYEVEASDTLTPPDWQLLEYLPDIGTNWWQLTDPDASSHTQRFYRVRWLQD